MGLSALDVVRWPPPGAFFCAFRGGRGGVCAEGPGGEGRARSPLGGCACTPGHARFFCGAKSRLLMAAGMVGQGKAARSFRTRLLMGLSASDAVGWLPRGLFAARFAGDGRRLRGGPRWGGTGAGPLLGTGRVDVALGRDERWPLKGKRTCRAGAVWRRLRGVGRCGDVAQGHATRGVHGHEGTCRASGQDAARLIADSGRHVPRRIRRDAHSAGGACRVNTGGRGMPRGAMSAGAFRVWAGRQSLCVGRSGLGRNGNLRAGTFCARAEQRPPRVDVRGLGETAISVREAFRAWSGQRSSRVGRSGLGQEGDFRAGAFRVWSGQRSPRRSVSRLVGTAIFTRGTFGAWAG